MSIPSAVKQRAEGINYIGVTGMEFAVQTGFAIRTGFYLTNSGSSTVLMSLSLDPNADDFDAYDFISGVSTPNSDNRISIPAGTTKFIPFDFYGLKDYAGPKAVSGPAGTGPYETEINLSFVSELNGAKDLTYYAGQPDLGVIRVNLTGYVTGHYGSTTELTPSHPEKFLGIINQQDDLGNYYHDLQWVNPPTGYYFEKYKIQRSTDATQTWNDLTTISLQKTPLYITLPASVGGDFLEAFYYGTPTGIDGYNSYTDSDLSPNTDYYYRIRGEHYDSINGSTLISNSDWVYCSGVDSFSQEVGSDVLTGLVSGSSSLTPTTNPDPSIKLSTGGKAAFKIYLQDRETNVVLSDKFREEIANLNGVDENNFLDYFSGVHFIVRSDYTIGSNTYGGDVPEPAIDTGGKIDIAGTELPMRLFLEEDATIMGMGGKGGLGGYIRVGWDSSANTFSFASGPDSTVGLAGGDAIVVRDDISDFKIHLPANFRIYAGGGGGGGGDKLFASRASALVREVLEDDTERNLTLFRDSNLDTNDLYLYRGNERLGQFNLSDFVGVHTAGFGGGGQGFGRSVPQGEMQRTNGVDGRVIPTNDKYYGNYRRAGAGKSANINEKQSDGGSGGAFGEYGTTPPSSSYDDGFSFVNLPDNIDSQSGGRGGYAIKVLSSSYSTANLNTLIYRSVPFHPDNIGGFIARWDASTTVYNTGTTPATNGQDVESWVAAAKNSNIAGNVRIENTSSGKPVFYDSGDNIGYFNNLPCLQFSGGAFATIKEVQYADNYSLNNDISSFDIFYVVLPTSLDLSYKQFNTDGSYKSGADYEFSKFGDSEGKHQLLYRSDGSIKDKTGMKNGKEISFRTANKNYLTLPASAFVYNITARKTGRLFTYKIYINNVLKAETTLEMDSFLFDIDPILGKHETACSFNISDIIMYRNQLLDKERDSVYSYLANRATSLKIITDSTIIDKTTPNNKLADESGFAGYIMRTV